MGFTDAVRANLNKFATISGRARRAEYWWFTVFIYLVMIVGGAISGAVTAVIPFLGAILMVVVAVAACALIIPAICVTIRRMHDLDRSGWWILVSFVPVVGTLILLFFLVSRGTEGDNRFGPDPLAGEY